MTNLPTVQVLLDDGSGTFPNDASTSVHLPSGVTVSGFGRTDEFSEANAAVLTLTLDNTTGLFTTGSSGGGWDTGGWDTGPWDTSGTATTELFVGQQVRVSLTTGSTTKQRFTGRITGADLGWPAGGQELSRVQISASDRLADCAGRTLRSMLEEEILLGAPEVYYTLGEPTGSTSAGDTSGNNAVSLAPAGTGLAKVTFGTGIGPTDGLPAAQFFGGQILVSTLYANTIPAPSTYGIGASFLIASNPSQNAVIAYRRGFSLQVSTSGNLLGLGPGFTVDSGVSVTDGSTHTAGFVWVTVGAPHWGLFLDGHAVGPITTTTTPTGSVLDATYVGGLPIFGNQFTGTISHVYGGSTVTSARVVGAGLVAAGSVEPVTSRLARLAGYGGLSSSATSGQSGQLVGPQATSGQSLLQALQDVEAAEGGFLYADGSGTLVLQGRGYRAAKTTADLTLTSDDVNSDVSVTLDNQQQVTYVTVTRNNGATQSVGTHTNGVADVSLSSVAASDGDALLAAQWLVAKHTTPTPRMGSATLGGDSSGGALASSPNAEAVLQRAVGDRLSFTPMPSQMWTTAGDVTLEGWTETVTDSEWSLTANLLPWTLQTALVLDDATYGALDTYPIMN